MGAEIGVGALLAASGISTLGNIAGSAISSSGANSANKQLMSFNSLEAEKNRQFQRDMYNQQLSDQERLYNQYQSPQAVAKQLQNIGLNPAAVLGKGSGFQSMGSVPSVPSGSQASVGSLLNPNSSYGDALKNTTKDAVSVLNSLTDKHLKDSQTIKVLAESKGQEYANQIAKIQAEVSSWQIPEHARSEINELISRSALNEANGNLSAAETSLKELISKLTNSQIKLTDEQVQQLSIEVAWLDRIRRQEFELLGEKSKTERSQQRSNYAGANLSDKQAYGQDISNKLQDIEFGRESDNVVKAARLNSLLASLSKSEMFDNAEKEKFKTQLNRYQRLNKNDENSVSAYVNYMLWFIKQNIEGLGILIPFGKK